MRTRPPELADATLAGALAEGWALDVGPLTYLPVGFGSHHWATTSSEGTTWFVTVHDLDAKRHGPEESLDGVHDRLRRALQTAADLRHRSGHRFVLAPVGAGVVHRIGERWTASLYPYLEGTAGEFDGPADEAVLAHLADLHRTDPAQTPEIGAEDFAVPNRAGLLDALAHLDDGPWDGGPYGEAARTRLRPEAERVHRAFARYDGLVAAEAARPERRVVTHGEPHPANVLVTPDGARLLIDWDTALLAPPERDLRHARGPGGDPDVLELYRLRWALEEVAGYALALRAPHEATEDTALFLEGLEEYLAEL